MSVTRRYAACLVSLLLWPAAGASQTRSTAERLRALQLDSLKGAVMVFYSSGYGARADSLQKSYSAAVRHYESMFAGGVSANLPTVLALLKPEHWSAVAARPYGAPHIDFSSWPTLVVVLPAANDRGFVSDLWRTAGLSSRLELARAVDVVGLHEFGHAFNVRFLYPLAAGTGNLSVKWFDEFMATYFGQGYLWHTQGPNADPLRPSLLAIVAPRYRTLTEFEEQQPYFNSAEGYLNYAWYQLQFASRGRDVFRNQGLDFIRRVREELPWSQYSSWTTDALLMWLDKIEPGFVAWAQALATVRHNRD